MQLPAQRHNPRHLDVGRGGAEGVELLGTEKHSGTTGASIERRHVERAVLALYTYDVPAVELADSAPPLPRVSHAAKG